MTGIYDVDDIIDLHDHKIYNYLQSYRLTYSIDYVFRLLCK